MEKQSKVIVLTIPYLGHINPALGIANQLVKSKIKVIFYAIPAYKRIIENSGSEYRDYSYFPITNDFIKQIRKDKNDDIDIILHSWTFMNTAARLLPELISIVESEKPDLILYDLMAVHAKLLLQYYINKNRPLNALRITTTFVMEPDVYPNNIEEPPMPPFKHGLKSFYYRMLIELHQISFSFKYGLGITHPINYVVETMDHQNLVTVFPELQPRSHLVHKSNQFIGNCISLELRDKDYKIDNTEINSVLSKFDPINPIRLSIDDYFLNNDINSDKKLVFVSLGTIFNNKIDVFMKIIDGLNSLNVSEDKGFTIEVIISCGKDISQKFEEKKRNEDFKLPSNFHVVDFAPQIEILKRASLFITHSGMNSISESILYGVPLVCVPVFWDQPRVAYRICDELGLGVRLPLQNLETTFIQQAAFTVLNDKAYHERILRYSKISNKYNGCINGANLIIDKLISS